MFFFCFSAIFTFAFHSFSFLSLCPPSVHACHILYVLPAFLCYCTLVCFVTRYCCTTFIFRDISILPLESWYCYVFASYSIPFYIFVFCFRLLYVYFLNLFLRILSFLPIFLICPSFLCVSLISAMSLFFSYCIFLLSFVPSFVVSCFNSVFAAFSFCFLFLLYNCLCFVKLR